MSSSSTPIDPARLVGRKQVKLTVSEQWMAALSGKASDSED
jgi:hypothetical protein